MYKSTNISPPPYKCTAAEMADIKKADILSFDAMHKSSRRIVSSHSARISKSFLDKICVIVSCIYT